MSFNKHMAEQAIATLRMQFVTAMKKAETSGENSDTADSLTAARHRFNEVIHLLEVVSGTARPMHPAVMGLGTTFDEAKAQAVASVTAYSTDDAHDPDDLEAVMQKIEEAQEAIEQADISAAMCLVHFSRAYRLLEK